MVIAIPHSFMLANVCFLFWHGSQFHVYKLLCLLICNYFLTKSVLLRSFIDAPERERERSLRRREQEGRRSDHRREVFQDHRGIALKKN